MKALSRLRRGGGRSGALTWAVALCWTCCLLPDVVGKYTPFLPQGFFFDWTPPGQSPPVPTTAQCDSIHITWERSTATGPNPTAPYFLQVFTSSFIVPFSIPAGDVNSLSFDWPVPFIPGTQYQICMWDSNGVSGGCQATYTVYQAPNTTLQTPPVCTNLTYPQPNQVLGVDALVDNGPISEYGWVDQCTDISLKPKNGTPPFTFTVAPALHPPYNITSNTMDAINWTVSLSWGMPFFISLTDSSGMSWANGPLHSGGGGPTDCLLQEDATVSEGRKVKPWVPVVSSIGGLIVGVLVGLAGAYFLQRRLRRRHGGRPDALHRKSSSMSMTTPVMSSPPHEHYRDLPSSDNSRDRLSRDPSYQIEPFVLPADREFGGRAPQSMVTPSSSGTAYDTVSTQPLTGYEHSRTQSMSVASPSSTVPPGSPENIAAPSRALSNEARSTSQVYVVHHDAGRPPVTVYTADGTEVVELPPRYNESAAGRANAMRSSSAAPLQERRSAGPSPPKPPPTRRVIN